MKDVIIHVVNEERVTTKRRKVEFNNSISYTNDIYVYGEIHTEAVSDNLLPTILRHVRKKYQ